MGGMIVQKLLTNDGKPLPFKIEHAVLTATSACVFPLSTLSRRVADAEIRCTGRELIQIC